MEEINKAYRLNEKEQNMNLLGLHRHPEVI
jgi:hypothetical protein